MNTNDSAKITKDIFTHIKEQLIRANLSDKPFELGILTDKRQSQILPLLHNTESFSQLKEIGMSEYKWHSDGLRSELSLAGECLMFSVCRSR